MAVYRIYPEKTSTIWSETDISGVYGNSGKDSILSIGTYKDVNQVSIKQRGLIQFSSTEILDTVDSKVSGDYRTILHLYLSEGSQIPSSFTIEGYPVSSSWTRGTGRFDDTPTNTTGVTWKYRDNQTNEWNTLGGDYITGSISSQSFSINSNLDLDLDITSLTQQWYTGSLDNNGLLLKLEDSLEDNTTSSINLSYFSRETNTIFPPYLEFRWDDTIYTGSLSILDTDISTISIKNNKEEYIDSDKSRFRLSVRPKYPQRTFTTSSIYLTNFRLPQNSYWGIKDEYSEEMIIDFDTTYTKISSDDNGSYFDVYMSSLQPERFYRLLIKTTLDGSDLVIDNKNIFKVVRNG